MKATIHFDGLTDFIKSEIERVISRQDIKATLDTQFEGKTLSLLLNRIKETNERLTELEGLVHTLEDDNKELRQRISDIEERTAMYNSDWRLYVGSKLDDLTEKSKSMDDKITDINSELDEANYSIGNLEEKTEEIDELERRIDSLEEKTENIDDNYISERTLEERLAGMEEDMGNEMTKRIDDYFTNENNPLEDCVHDALVEAVQNMKIVIKKD